jgi:glycosyltransferase involved in cell wall biosynthesis
MKISILITNFNNAKLLDRSIKSALSQSYKNKEIIVFDDCSSDGSQKKILGYKSIKKIFINKKVYRGSFGQLNAIEKCLKHCTGEVISLLDSDDFFDKHKLKKVASYYKKNRSINYVSDKPVIYFNNSFKIFDKRKFYKKRFFSWPSFSPHSSLSIKKKFLEKNKNLIFIKKYKYTWLDFRLGILNYLMNNEFGLIDEYLTFYQQSKNSATANYKKFNYIWWRRRFDSFRYIKFLKNKKNIKKIKFLFDYYLTCFIYKLLKFQKIK